MNGDIDVSIDQRPIEATIGDNTIESVIDQRPIESTIGDNTIEANIDQRPIEAFIEGAYVQILPTESQTLLITARKASAGTITKGQVVYIVGSTGNHLTVELAQANLEATSAYTIGIAATTITGNSDGSIMQYGRLSGLSTVPTASFSDGDAIYLSETTAGAYRVGIPEAPNHGVLLGFVIRANNGNAGEIDVRIQNYQELEELSDVYINNKATNDFLVRKTNRWENVSLANAKTILGVQDTFETVSKNLKAYPASLNYTSGTLTSIVYTLPSGTITKTLNYTSGTLTSIVLSGNTPSGISLTKTLGYTGGILTSITYS